MDIVCRLEDASVVSQFLQHLQTLNDTYETTVRQRSIPEERLHLKCEHMYLFSFWKHVQLFSTDLPAVPGVLLVWHGGSGWQKPGCWWGCSCCEESPGCHHHRLKWKNKAGSSLFCPRNHTHWQSCVLLSHCFIKVCQRFLSHHKRRMKELCKQVGL